MQNLPGDDQVSINMVARILFKDSNESFHSVFHSNFACFLNNISKGTACWKDMEMNLFKEVNIPFIMLISFLEIGVFI